ncbi:MAG: hypothetical protein KF869_15270 [Phycisphaeraceae bacterium]|nr:hypothetical protein [Phycisphaeraceae bacterium]
MTDRPSPNRANGKGDGRDGGGRFAPGWRGGPGNPHAAAVGRLRSALLKEVGPDDIRAVIRALVEKAKTGDVPAIRELLDRTLGRSVEADLIERLEELEAQVAAKVPGRALL